MANPEGDHALKSPSRELSDSSISCDPLRKVVLSTADHCVICLDVISEKAIALPCRHEQFDFPCLGTWLQRQQVCPLCKAEVKAIRFNVGEKDNDGTKVFYLPAPEEALPRKNFEAVAARQRQRRARQQQRWLSRGTREGRHQQHNGAQSRVADSKDSALTFRRNVYRNSLYSLHVGSNRISRYRAITPTSFQKDEHLVSRARAFTRRELSVFDFLNPDSPSTSASGSATTSPSSSRDHRRANNADFLLEYVISILKSIDLKGSTGQAEELLTDFLGRENARLFIHELQAWLRSPYERLEDWDRNVQYAIPTSVTEEHGDLTVNHVMGVKGRRRLGSSNAEATAAPVPRWFSDGFVLGDRGWAEPRAPP